MMRPSLSLSVAVFVLALGGPVAAQDSSFFCRPPEHTVETAKARLLELSNPNSISGFVDRLAAPGAGPTCPALRPDEDLHAAIDEMIRFVADLGDERRDLQREFFMSLNVALKQQDIPRPPIPLMDGRRRPQGTYTPVRVSLPLEALIYAVERGTAAGALSTLLAFQHVPEVRSYLLRRARAERGPASAPGLPRQIMRMVYPPDGIPTPYPELAADLEADPSLVRNRLRCWVERGRRPDLDRPPVAPGEPPRCPAG